jgi:hypothetical protein
MYANNIKRAYKSIAHYCANRVFEQIAVRIWGGIGQIFTNYLKMHDCFRYLWQHAQYYDGGLSKWH